MGQATPSHKVRKSDPLIPPLPASKKTGCIRSFIRAQMSVLKLRCRHVCVFVFLGFHVFSVFTANDVCDVCMNKITCERRILIYDDICLRPHARLYASKLPCYDPLCYVLSCVTLAARFVPVCSVRTLADLVLCVGTHTTPWFERSSKL